VKKNLLLSAHAATTLTGGGAVQGVLGLDANAVMPFALRKDEVFRPIPIITQLSISSKREG
jgi:hypothetical protein